MAILSYTTACTFAQRHRKLGEKNASFGSFNPACDLGIADVHCPGQPRSSKPSKAAHRNTVSLEYATKDIQDGVLAHAACCSALY
jgi:hypothetical protein